MMPCGLWISVVDHALDPRLHAERGEVEASGLLVEQAQHDAFAMTGGYRRHAHVDGAAGDAQADAAVLRQALFGDVETRHHLDARDQERRNRALGLQHLAQHAVHAEPDDQAVLVGLDVDVGGVFLDGLGQYGIDQPDDRRIVLAFHEVRWFRQSLRETREIRFALDAFDDLACLTAAALVGLAQQVVEGGGGDALNDERHAEEAAQFRDCRGLCAFAVDDLGLAVEDRPHQHAMALGEGKWQPPDGGDRPWRHARNHRPRGHSPGPSGAGAVAMSFGGGGDAMGGAVGPISGGSVGRFSPGISLTLPLFWSSCRLRR